MRLYRTSPAAIHHDTLPARVVQALLLSGFCGNARAKSGCFPRGRFPRLGLDMYVISLLLCGVAGAPSESDVAVAQTLRAAVEQWQTQVAFRSSYRLRGGFANSVEDARRGEINAKLGGGYAIRFEAAGVFHKEGPKLRCSIEFAGGRVLLSAGADGAPPATANRPWDEVSDGRVQVSYYPPTTLRPAIGQFGNAAQVEKRRPETADMAAGCATEIYINPLKPWPNPNEDFLGHGALVGVEAVDEQHLEVARQERSEIGLETNRRVLFWTNPSPPVIEKVSAEYLEPDGTRRQSFTSLSDFKQCPGGLVARRVLHVAVLSRDHIAVQEWRSDDLGDRRPSGDDFAITVAPTTKIMGFKDTSAQAKLRRLEPSKIQLAELIDYQALKQESEQMRRAYDQATHPPARRTPIWLIWSGGGLAVVLVLIFVLRRRSS